MGKSSWSVIYGNPQQLEYDFVVAPHADPRRIRLQIEGAQSLSVDGNDDLDRTLRQLRPVIYQPEDGGGRRATQGRYTVSHGSFSFALGGYDPSRALIIDPRFVYSTYFSAYAFAIATDGQGNAYIAGSATTALPLEAPLQGTDLENGLFYTAFISKLNPAGTGLVYSTYLGGSGNGRSGNLGFCGQGGENGPAFDNGGDGATALAVDAAGNAYIAGFTSSSDFPTVAPLQAANNAAVNHGSNAFVAKLNSAGDALVYSTYLGGSGVPGALTTGDSAAAIAVDQTGSAYVAGITTSADFPTVAPFQAGNLESSARPTGFVAKLSSTGSALVYSSYLGGSGGSDGSDIGDCANAIAVDTDGNAYVAGQTSSTDFLVAAAFQPVNRAAATGGTGFLSKLNTAGSALTYSTYLGGSGSDSALAVAVDTLGDAYVAGYTSSTDFPVANALQPASATAPGADTGFVTKFNPAGSGLIYSTYLGGSNRDGASALAVDATGNAYVAGYTYSDDFPVATAVQSSNNAASRGGNNAFVAVLDSAGSELTFSTYLGGSGIAVYPSCPAGVSPCPPSYIGDSAVAIAVDAAGDIYVTGLAYSTDFPTVSAFQTQPAATFVTKISPAPAPVATQLPPKSGGGALGWGVIIVLGFAVAMRRLRRHDRRSTPMSR